MYFTIGWSRLKSEVTTTEREHVGTIIAVKTLRIEDIGVHDVRWDDCVV